MPIWVRMGIGKPRCDTAGVPVYETWEVAADGLIHAAGVLWTSASVGALLTVSRAPRYWVYSACILLVFCTSAMYNMVGCALRTRTETLRRLDQASIFIAAGGLYTVFVLDPRVLAAVWGVCGTGAVLKATMGRRIEIPAMLAYAGLLVLPIGLVPVHSRAYPTVVGCAATIAVGGVFGYLNNYPGAMPFWHACVLSASVAYWTLVFGAAQHGVQFYLKGGASPPLAGAS
jgi:channel protein (hemolysin III family)